MVVLGVILLAIGGLAAGSFYIPLKKVKGWAWESYWIVNGFFSWIITPWIVALITVPNLTRALKDTPSSNILWCYLFGLLWGIGGLTFGLSMRYLGMSLGYALALGFCAAFGTIMPPLYKGIFGSLLETVSGRVALSGVLICLAGIAVCGKAGMRKEKEMSEDAKKSSIKEFNFFKGIWVALFAGIMSSCMAFGINAGKPISQLAVKYGTPSLWQNGPVLVVILMGGFTTNFIWSVMLNIKNKSAKDYLERSNPDFWKNYLFASLAGIIWYMQVMFYGMGTTKMGKYDFASWTILMAFVIIFSNLWGLFFHEWKGASKKTLITIVTGITIVFLSTCVIGYSSYLAATGH
jgi:L-rhamnose-H+ transport protein